MMRNFWQPTTRRNVKEERLLEIARAKNWSSDEQRQSYVDVVGKDPAFLREQLKGLDYYFTSFIDSLKKIGDSLVSVTDDSTPLEDRISSVSTYIHLLAQPRDRSDALLNGAFLLLKARDELDQSLSGGLDLLAEIYALSRETGHELSNCLTIVASLAEVQLHDPNPEDLENLRTKGKHITNIAMGIRDYIFHLCDNMLFFESDIFKVIKEVVKSPKKNSFSLDSEVNTSQEYINGSLALYRAFYNLVTNQYKRGKATKGMIRASDAQLERAAAVRFEVMDNGCGLPDAEDLFRWGESYSGGTGIGLATVKRIIRDHSGSIEAIPKNDDPVYKGACFVVTLPIKFTEYVPSHPSEFYDKD